MADTVTNPDDDLNTPADNDPDIEMSTKETNDPDIIPADESDNDDENLPDDALPPSTALSSTTETPPSFLTYLRSPIVSLAIGPASNPTILTAHEALLSKSPWFAEACAAHSPSSSSRTISLPDEDLPAVGSVLEYLYNGEYFPRRLGTGRTATLESNPTLAPLPDNTGASLLKHARIYTLAGKLSLPALQSLAHAKIHRTTSTAKGEIAYARYVYANSPKEDAAIRRPVAAFWATRSHVLRHEAEREFRSMCLEFPEFGFDVLSLVLDQREKGKGGVGGGGGGGSVGVVVGAGSGSGGGAVEGKGTPSRVVGGKTRKRARLSTG